MSTRSIRLALAAAAVALAASCDDDDPTSTTPPSTTGTPPVPTVWSAAVTNPLFPLTPGTTSEFSGETAEGTETSKFEVLTRTRVVNGVTATAVRDRVFLDGELIEDTEDWFAQDTAGNVWYLGEASKDIENGKVVSTEGSWEWGVNDALPGIIMWADPSAHIGQDYQQEFAKGVAEDQGKVVSVNEAVTVPFGSFTGCTKTEERNNLEPGTLENKFYCAGLGTTLELVPTAGERIELVNVTTKP